MYTYGPRRDGEIINRVTTPVNYSVVYGRRRKGTCRISQKTKKERKKRKSGIPIEITMAGEFVLLTTNNGGGGASGKATREPAHSFFRIFFFSFFWFVAHNIRFSRVFRRYTIAHRENTELPGFFNRGRAERKLYVK